MALDHTRALKDEIIIGGMMMMITYTCLATYSVVTLHAPFDTLNFATGAAAILGAIGGGQGLREWLSNKGGTDAKPTNG